MQGTTHVVGAGLAGLSAGLALADAGRRVVLHEAGPAAGGRCRSYHDRALGLTIDNGNHLLLSGNAAAFAYLNRIGAAGTMAGPDVPLFPFVEVPNPQTPGGARWTVRPSAGRVPWWIFQPGRRVPGTRMADYLGLLALRFVRDDRSVAAALKPGPLARRLVEPLAIAALNTPTGTGLARLLGAVVRETLMQGGAACLPRFPRESLAASLIDPAIAALRAAGAEIGFSRRIAALDIVGNEVRALRGPDGAIPIGRGDAVVLAVPPWVAADLLPGLRAPDEFEAILNVHFRADADPAGTDWAEAGFVGVVGGTAEWVFVKPGHVSVTISAANRMVDDAADDIAAAVWPDVCAAVGFDGPMPAFRVVKEKRATFAATAEQDRKRPGARTGLANLALAGDWTATGLPATIEGAIRSGSAAARIILAR
ncbi:MAG: FAD-dependent oxidoreductase [Proteobacteria bacterium]|nr:FAD-dependent oxidoreductase [Pseudomonadota bacterium]